MSSNDLLWPGACPNRAADPAPGRIAMRRLLFGSVVLAIALACSDSIGPRSAPVPASQLHIVVQAVAAPPLLTDSVSFYALLGQDREVRKYYQGAAPGSAGSEILRFKWPGNGLLLRPSGARVR